MNDQQYQQINDALEFRYHDIYMEFGEIQKNGMFHCFNAVNHEGGVDKNPSMGVDNETGVYHCFSCSVKGNLTTYYKEFVKSTGQDSWSGNTMKFMSDMAGIPFVDNKKLDEEEHLRKYTRALEGLRRKKEATKKYFDVEALSSDDYVRYTSALLDNNAWKKYLYDNRRITEDVIKEHRLGLKNGKIVFPCIDRHGKIVNAKMYDPNTKDPRYKWSYAAKGVGVRPGPISCMDQTKFYIMEGEPDTYCGISMGLNCVTFGGASNTDLAKIFGGENEVEYFFKEKEVTIVLDADDAGKSNVDKLAENILKYAKQVKILDLDASDIFPEGLNSNLKKVNGKRAETDFTDLMKKHKFDIGVFKKLEGVTDVYSSPQKKSGKSLNVTLAESTKDVYYDADSKIHLNTIALIDDVNDKLYKIPLELRVSCQNLVNCNSDAKGACLGCPLYTHDDYLTPDIDHINYKLSPYHLNAKDKDTDINVSEYDLLRLVNVNESDRKKVKKEIIGIPQRCMHGVKLDETKLADVRHVGLKEVVSIAKTTERMDTALTIEAYIVGNSDKFEPNRQYKIEAIQTKWHFNQSSVLYVYNAESLENEYDNYELTTENRKMLSVFKPREGEDIRAALKRRYSIFSAREGLIGRNELFFMSDLAYFSPIELNSPSIPSVSRGWVEILIVGASRCGKSIAVKSAHRRYNIGEMILSSEGLSKAGLLMGMNDNRVRGGAAPRNDRGILMIDEMSDISREVINQMKAMRDNGIAQVKFAGIDVTKSARCRKIFCSNWREDSGVLSTDNGGHIDNLVDLCTTTSSLTRFDLVTILRADDVDLSDYVLPTSIPNDFTDYQCRSLLKYVWSRKSEDYVFEDGTHEMIEACKLELTTMFHGDTHMVNAELTAKLLRMAMSLAGIIFSTCDDDSKIFVTCEHIAYIKDFMIELYCGPNMKFDEFSNKLYSEEKLGNTVFLDALLQEVDVDYLMHRLNAGVSNQELKAIFADYLAEVNKGRKGITKAKMSKGGKDSIDTGHSENSAGTKLVSILQTRHYIKKKGRSNILISTTGMNSFMKKWIIDDENNTRTHSDILELNGNGVTALDQILGRPAS